MMVLMEVGVVIRNGAETKADNRPGYYYIHRAKQAGTTDGDSGNDTILIHSLRAICITQHGAAQSKNM